MDALQADRLMTEAEVEDFIFWKRGSIARMRVATGTCRRSSRVSTRPIRYRRSAVENYLNQRTVTPGTTR